ncbi:MAG: hypothetical protein ABGF52_09510 [Candidatus Asgardarchaeum sp.]
MMKKIFSSAISYNIVLINKAVIENNYLIDRFTENHIIRTYTLDDIRRILKENGYNVLGIYSLPELDNNEDKVKRSFTMRVVAEKYV